MASTLKKAPLEVSIIETYSLNGRDHVVKSSTIYEDIRETSSKIITCAAGSDSGTSILDISGDYTKADIRYIRITNLDDGQTSNFNGTVQMRVFRQPVNGPVQIYSVWLTAGSSFIITDVITSDTVPAGNAERIGWIEIQNDTDVDANAIDVDVEVFVASV